jgi:hypothetical protein
MRFGLRPRSLRPWAVLGAWGVLSCQFPDYDLGRPAPSAGTGATGEAGSSGGGEPPSLGGSGSGGGGGAGATSAGGAGTSGGGTGAQPNAGSETGGQGGSAGSAGSVGTAGNAEAGAAGTPGDPKVLLEDDFQTGGAAQWFEVAGSPWSVALDGADGNRAYQLTPLFNDFYASAAKDGPWTDQILEADVKILAFGGTSSTDIVSLFGRFGNIDNYYAAVLRPDGRVAIRLRLAGASPTTLKTSTTLGITTGVWYRVRFELVADALRLYVDEQLRVEVQDSSLAKGTVALGGDNSAAAFDNARVTLP